jgi:hypothetical protein
MLVDPDILAVLLAIGGAVVLALATVPGAVRRRRALQRACLSCGRRLILGQQTCDCD